MHVLCSMSFIDDHNIPLASGIKHFVIHGKASWAINYNALFVPEFFYHSRPFFWTAIYNDGLHVFVGWNPSSNFIEPIVHQSSRNHHQGFIYEALELKSCQEHRDLNSFTQTHVVSKDTTILCFEVFVQESYTGDLVVEKPSVNALVDGKNFVALYFLFHFSIWASLFWPGCLPDLSG